MVMGRKRLIGKRHGQTGMGLSVAADDTFRDSTSIVFENNDLLLETIGKSHYMTWWWLADKWPEQQKVCETMAQLVCHGSRLKSDDIRYKGASMSTRSCHICELGVVESVVHLAMSSF